MISLLATVIKDISAGNSDENIIYIHQYCNKSRARVKCKKIVVSMTLNKAILNQSVEEISEPTSTSRCLLQAIDGFSKFVYPCISVISLMAGIDDNWKYQRGTLIQTSSRRSSCNKLFVTSG